jgi:hypothetical protein
MEISLLEVDAMINPPLDFTWDSDDLFYTVSQIDGMGQDWNGTDEILLSYVRSVSYTIHLNSTCQGSVQQPSAKPE